MQLFSKSFGTASSHIIILHGLLGSSDNWQTIARQLSENFTVHILDARNHGRSPHTAIIDYNCMMADVVEYIKVQELESAILMGHSMGGKTAMLTALNFPDLISKLVVVDIAPKVYDGGHEHILFAMAEAPLHATHSRADIEAFLQKRISDFGIRQFILKNLSRDENGNFEWKCNVEGIIHAYRNLMEFPIAAAVYTSPTYFIRGANSDYIIPTDNYVINRHFPNSNILTIPHAGHWVHAEQPQLFLETLNKVLLA